VYPKPSLETVWKDGVTKPDNFVTKAAIDAALSEVEGLNAD
jgi:hypothetical protein